MSVLKMTDSPTDMLAAVSKGNPGCLMLLLEIMKKHESIDPQAVMGGIGLVMLLDSYEIYGTDAYILYGDKCNHDLRTFLMLMRATQLGLFSLKRLKELSKDQMREIELSKEELDSLDEKVCAKLTEFKRKEEPVEEVCHGRI